MDTKKPDAVLPGTHEKTDDQWQSELTPTQYQVMRCHGTEMAGTSPLNKEKRAGMYRCTACGTPLFSSETKFDSGTGWPSFDAPLEDGVETSIDRSHVETSIDRSHFMARTEVHCKNCGGHLGHVFPDGPTPTGQRYCMNGVALKFEEKK
jgi:peptide-methionine (R)-S-oxide reductase